jgi:hypothetical protein
LGLVGANATEIHIDNTGKGLEAAPNRAESLLYISKTPTYLAGAEVVYMFTYILIFVYIHMHINIHIYFNFIYIL